jgi:hypothetical protein
MPVIVTPEPSGASDYPHYWDGRASSGGMRLLP